MTARPSGYLATYAAVALVVASLLGSAAARDVVVSPAGTPEGDGTAAKPLDIVSAFSVAGPAKPGDTLRLVAGTYEGAGQEKISTSRVPFLLAVSGEKDRPIRVMPTSAFARVHMNGCVEITASHVTLIDLEIGDTDWSPDAMALRARPTVSLKKCADVSLVNCNIFGGQGGGIEAATDVVDLTIYGCLIHDFGVLGSSTIPMAMEDVTIVVSGAGEGVTLANTEGTKVLTHNLLYRGCGGNLQVSRETVGYDFIENVSFASKGRKTNENMDSFPICSNYQRGPAIPMDRIRMIGNVAYQPVDISDWRSNMRLISYRPDALNEHAVAKENLLFGAANGLSLTRWKRLELTGNTVWATQSYIRMNPGRQPTPDELKGWRVDGNTYIANGNADGFQHGRGGDVTFAGWRKLGFDVNGRLLPGRDGRPAGTLVRVFPNKHQKRQGCPQNQKGGETDPRRLKVCFALGK